MHIAFSKDSAYRQPHLLSADDNWGFGTEQEGETEEFQVCCCAWIQEALWSSLLTVG
jgi:hypothetical protein